jgi:ATP-binding cassette subfamily F protein 3
MAVLIASNLRKEFSGDPLFSGVSFTVNRRDRLSLAGPNGAGKTTLLRAIAGETSIQGGELAFSKGARIALHDQRPPRDLGYTLREYALSGASDLLAVEAELRRLEGEMEEGAHDAATLRRYAEAQGRLEHAGGWAWRDRVASAVRGLGFADPDLDRRLETFSGGELTRASLARALAGDPDLLLLDEPTNHLDVDSLEWLERELDSLDAAVVLVAHDRWFLESVTTAVLELAPGGAHYFAGPWHEWRREKAARATAAARTAERMSEDIARLERFVERFRYKKSKAKQAQAKLTQIGRLEKERSRAAREHESLTRKRKSLGFDFLAPPRTGRVVLDAEGVALVAGDKPLLDDAALVVERGEKVALVGPNGSGKTTLLEAILGTGAVERGAVRLGHGVVPAYFSQHTQELPDRGSVLDCAAEATRLPRPQAQALLGRFLFSGWETHERPVSALSGGERRRLAPRRREPGGARGRPGGLPRHCARRLARPRAARRSAGPHRGDRGPGAALLRRRLGGSAARTLGESRGGRGAAQAASDEDEQAGAAAGSDEAEALDGARARGGPHRGGGGPGRGARTGARSRLDEHGRPLGPPSRP